MILLSIKVFFSLTHGYHCGGSVVYILYAHADLDPDPNWATILDPNPNSIYLDPKHWYALLTYEPGGIRCKDF